MERIDDAADDAPGPELLDVGGDGKRGLEILTDREDDRIALLDRDFVERVQVGAVGLDDVFDLILERVDVGGVVVHGDDFMPVPVELAGEVGAETSKADDAESHGFKWVRVR